ncbi:MAG TPA: molybdopterin-dependent oxidoreductase [Candidatus Tectomicrobia bacterium]|nr:molybdopterin-dependent oxidoreductase [Candidatus Tectomicrobia bacterium]
MSQALEVCGQVRQPGRFDFAALTRLPGQIDDIATLVPGRSGGAVRLVSLLDAVHPDAEATYITVESNDGSFSASVPLAAVVESAVVLYRLGGRALPEGQGGPFRFLITDAQACATGGADLCANVKFVGRIALSTGPGRDTRPGEGKTS